MKKYILIALIITLGLNTPVFAFHGAIEGKVHDQKGNPLVSAQIWLEGYTIGGVTDGNGKYTIEVPNHGEFKVVYQYIGFTPETLTVTVMHGQTVKKDVILKESFIQLKEVEVTGRKETIHRIKTPEPITVIPQEAAEKSGASTLGEAIELEPGVELQTKCSMCNNTSEVSIQGLPGRFSLILFEGLPIVSGLASRYILAFPSSFMDRVEILKGASGAIWGSDAISGAINVTLPQPSPQLITKASYTYRNYGNEIYGMFNNSYNTIGITGMAAHSERGFVDLNKDKISENTAHLGDIYLTSIKITPSPFYDLTFGGSITNEVRKSGAIIPEYEYGTIPNAEKISARCWNLWNQSRINSQIVPLKFKIAASSYTEDGIVENKNYAAEQKNLYSEFSAMLGQFTLGISFNHEYLYDVRLFEAYDEDNYGIGLSSPHWKTGGMEVFTAARVDFNSEYGEIFSPYGAVKFTLLGLDFNFAAGTGYRTPSIIFGSVENLPAGYRYTVKRDTNLLNEKGFSAEGGVSKLTTIGNLIVDFKLNSFYHHVSNFINSRLDGIDSVTQRAVFYYYNLDEEVTSKGIEISSNFTPYSNNIDLTIGGFALSPESENGQTLPFINQWGADYSVTYRKDSELEFNITGNVNGPMAVQTVYKDGSVHHHNSPVYSVSNFNTSKKFGPIKFNLGINNLFDYYLKQHGEGETEYYWGPIIGREFYGKISVEFGN
ncbi:MAG: TonB-dependent receptor [bacterium]|nr:TonB-dependent receptor [bacterium]